ncbi:MAG: hypothetical protein JXR25_00640 [Pontiellaceae bacterium]|nr:hypothetical protein [Pontiellaceae bacterium]MBN2783305.1 hypothetical protein [Pontiellaceae bacterium]
MKYLTVILAIAALTATSATARIKMVALPERADTDIRLDNPTVTLIEEERVLTLQQGLNQVDFSWNGVSIDADSIRLQVIDHPDSVTLLNVSYPPNEQALVWEISSAEAVQETVRISYLLYNIDRLVTYKLVADKNETQVDFKSHLVLRNFSGEDFENARVLLDYGEAFERGIQHEETKQLLFLSPGEIAVEKVWTFDAAALPWDPEYVGGNVGIPVSYVIKNTKANGLGEFALNGGKARVYQDDGRGGTIVLGEDNTQPVPVGEAMKIYIGDSRDITVVQKKMNDKQINIRRNNDGKIVLHDTDELITATIENFKDTPARLTLIQHIDGQWDMEACNMEYTLDDASTLKFEIELAANSKQEFSMHYHRRNIRP